MIHRHRRRFQNGYLVRHWRTHHLPEVRVVDFEMSFGSMVIFMVKWAFAAIPAVIMIFGICLFILAALTAGGYGVGSMLSPTK